MMKKIEEHPVTYTDAKNILTKREKEGELGYEQKITLDYLRKFATLSKKDVEDATAELSKIEGLKEHQIVALLNLLPEDDEGVKNIFMKERNAPEAAQIKQILDALAKVRPKE